MLWSIIVKIHISKISLYFLDFYLNVIFVTHGMFISWNWKCFCLITNYEFFVILFKTYQQFHTFNWLQIHFKHNSWFIDSFEYNNFVLCNDIDMKKMFPLYIYFFLLKMLVRHNLWPDNQVKTYRHWSTIRNKQFIF